MHDCDGLLSSIPVLQLTPRCSASPSKRCLWVSLIRQIKWISHIESFYPHLAFFTFLSAFKPLDAFVIALVDLGININTTFNSRFIATFLRKSKTFCNMQQQISMHFKVTRAMETSHTDS